MGNDNPYSDMFEAYVAHLYHNMKGSSRNKSAIIRTYFVLIDLKLGFSFRMIEDHRLLALMAILSRYIGTVKGKNDADAQRLLHETKHYLHDFLYIRSI